jgi:hypothetical protein
MEAPRRFAGRPDAAARKNLTPGIHRLQEGEGGHATINLQGMFKILDMGKLQELLFRQGAA